MAGMGCPRCGALVATEDVDLARELADCQSCQSVFDLRNQVVVPDEHPLRARKLPVPEGVIVIEELDGGAPTDVSTYRQRPSQHKGTLRIMQRWGGRRMPALAASAAVGMLLLVVVVAGEPRTGASLAAMLCGVPIALVGANGLGWSVHRMTVTVDAGHVRVVRGPIPWRRGTSVTSTSLRRVGIARRRAELTKDGFAYSVTAETSDDATKVLVADLPTEALARFIATLLSERLDLPLPL